MQSKEIVSINGEIFDLSEGKISVQDHCVLFGDGVFEGIRLINGGVLLHKEHLERLYTSAEGVRLPIVPPAEYERQLFSAIKASGLASGYIRVVLTRGVAGLDLNPTRCVDSKLIVIVATLKLFPDELYEKGVKLIIARTNKVPYRSFDCRIKSCNYLSNLMALWEAIDSGASEAIMTDENGVVSETTMANIFGVTNGLLFTPGSDTNCLEGITRAKVMEIGLEQSLKVEQGRYTSRDFMLADEVFLTGTGAGVLPVTQIENKMIGKGSIGATTRMLRDEYEKRLDGYCTPVE